MKRRMQLGNMKVKEVQHLLVENPSVIKEDATIEQVLAKINEDPRTRHVYVVDNCNKLIGSVRMNTVVKDLFPITAIVDGLDDVSHDCFVSFGVKTVNSIMNEKPLFVKGETLLSEMAKILMHEKINELPVVDDEMKVIGQVNVYEVIKAYLKE